MSNVPVVMNTDKQDGLVLNKGGCLLYYIQYDVILQSNHQGHKLLSLKVFKWGQDRLSDWPKDKEAAVAQVFHVKINEWILDCEDRT